jgi:hypothetical protein
MTNSTLKLAAKMSITEACNVLGLNLNTLDKSKLKTRYRQLVLQYHPDYASPENKSMAEAKMKEINPARDVVEDYLRLHPTPIYTEPKTQYTPNTSHIPKPYTRTTQSPSPSINMTETNRLFVESKVDFENIRRKEVRNNEDLTETVNKIKKTIANITKCREAYNKIRDLNKSIQCSTMIVELQRILEIETSTDAHHFEIRNAYDVAMNLTKKIADNPGSLSTKNDIKRAQDLFKLCLKFTNRHVEATRNLDSGVCVKCQTTSHSCSKMLKILEALLGKLG